MDKQQFEDVSPIKTGDFHRHVSIIVHHLLSIHYLPWIGLLLWPGKALMITCKICKYFWRPYMSALSTLKKTSGWTVEIDAGTRILSIKWCIQSQISTPNSLRIFMNFPRLTTSPSCKSNAMPLAIVVGKLLKYCCWSWSNLASAVPSTSPAGHLVVLQRLGCFSSSTDGCDCRAAKLPMLCQQKTT